MSSQKQGVQIDTVGNFLFWNNLFGIMSIAYSIGIFYGYGRLIEESRWVGFLHIIAAIIFFFIRYRIKVKVTLMLVFLSLILAGAQVIWVANQYDYFTPLPYLPWLLAFSASYRLYKSIKKNELNIIESINPNN